MSTQVPPAWDLKTYYLAFALVNLIYAYSPQWIILGGGVSQHVGLIDEVRSQVKQFINGYIQASVFVDQIDQYILPPALGNRSGGLGAIAMTRRLACEGQ